MSRIDPERIGSLLDGRLAAAGRDALFTELATGDDLDYLTFVETEGVLAELRGETEPSAGTDPAPAREAGRDADVAAPTEAPADPTILPLRPRGPRWRAPALAGVLALAALIAAMALVPALRPWGRAAGPLDDPGRALALLSSPESGAPVLGAERPWSGLYRGEAPVSEHGRAVRTGAYLVDLRLAAAAHDARLRGLADTVASLVAEVPGGGAAAALYRGVPDQAASGADVRGMLNDGDGAVRDLLPRDGLELGIWAEAARIAAARRDAPFFRSSASRGALARARSLAWLSDDGRAARSSVASALPVGGAPDWEKLGPALGELEREAGR